MFIARNSCTIHIVVNHRPLLLDHIFVDFRAIRVLLDLLHEITIDVGKHFSLVFGFLKLLLKKLVVILDSEGIFGFCRLLDLFFKPRIFSVFRSFDERVTDLTRIVLIDCVKFFVDGFVNKANILCIGFLVLLFLGIF